MPFFVLSILILFCTPCFSQTQNESPDQVWEVGDRRWTVEEEQQFEKWVDETISEDFFIRYKIPTDCADAVYAIRWIYARMAHLPAAATTIERKRVGHWSTDWKHLPTHPEWDKDERFRAALLYVLSKTWTGTLPLDTYPVRISPDSVTPGTVFLVTESHAGMIGHVYVDGSQAHPLQTWESVPPVRVQKLITGYFFSGRPRSKDRSGLVKFQWPISERGEWRYLPVTEYPFYSEEQYATDFCEGYADFVEAVARRIDPTNYAPMEKMKKVVETITRRLRERAPVVLEGYLQCRDGSCPEGSEVWEMYSTPGRDGMIISLMDHLSQIIASNHFDPEMVKAMMESISITISEDRSVTFYHGYQNYLWFSPHPGDSIDARWGLKKCEMIYAQTRTTQDSIEFINRTYRRKDPQYADFSIRQQEHVLRKLNQEWTRSECIEPPVTQEPVSLSAESWIEARWEVRKCETIRADTRATQDSIAFIENTYREKDPAYADFSIQQQQLLQQKLNEEWVRSKCQEGP